MRPPEAAEAREGVATVLTTTAELAVVKNTLDQGKPPVQDFDAATPVGAGVRASLRKRFNKQTREIHVTSGERTYGSIPEETPIVSGWKDGAEFQVLHEDVPFIQRAAKKVILERRPLRRAWNRAAGRTEAAENMDAELAKVGIAKFERHKYRPSLLD